MRSFPSSWPRTHRIALIRTVVALAIVYAAYLVAANAFLNSALAERAFNRQPERFHIQWAHAYSLYPGHVHATGLRLGGHVRRNRWTTTSPDASGRVKLLPLLLRRLSFGPISARDVTLVVDTNEPSLAPLTSTSPLPPWKLHFDAIHTETLRQLRIGSLLIDDMHDAVATFALDKTLRGGAFGILPSSLHVRAARMDLGGVTLARDARIDYTMTMAPNTYQQAHGFARVRFMDARLQLSGRAPGLSIGGGDRDVLGFDTGNTGGRVEADLSIRQGVLQPGGSLRWSAPLVQDSNGQADPHPERLQVRADVHADGIAVRARVPKRAGSEDSIDADLRVAERRLQRTTPHELLRKTSGTIAMRWHFRSLDWLNPMLTKEGWLRLGGQADVIAQLRIDDGHLAPGSRVQVPAAKVETDLFDTVLSGQMQADALVDKQHTTIDFVARQFQLAPRDARTQPYVIGRDARLQLIASEDLAQFRRTMQAHLDFDDARVPRLQAYNRNLPGNSLRLDGGSGTFGADLRLDGQGHVQQGRLRLRGSNAQVQLGPSRILGDVAVDTRITRTGSGPRNYRIDALDLRLDHVRVDDPKAAPWWARLALDNGHLEWRQPFQLQGDARVEMKDVSVLLTLFSERSAFPKWIGNLIDAGQARATGHVRFDQDTVTLSPLHASNDRIDLDARLRITNGQPRGALYAKWGVLGVGVQLHDGKRDFHLANAKQWYEALPPLDAAAAAKPR
jgi:hypothetical protein